MGGGDGPAVGRICCVGDARGVAAGLARVGLAEVTKARLGLLCASICSLVDRAAVAVAPEAAADVCCPVVPCTGLEARVTAGEERAEPRPGGSAGGEAGLYAGRAGVAGFACDCDCSCSDATAALR